MRRTGMNCASDIPAGLPDRLINPAIDLDPDSDVQNRRMEAFGSFRVYSRELEMWLRKHSPQSNPKRVMDALGTNLGTFLRVAEELP